jgi:hypothetical protein
MFFLSSLGKVYQLQREEMAAAEAIGHEVDFMLRYCYMGMLGVPQGVNQRDLMKSFRKTSLEKQELIESVTFPSLGGLEHEFAAQSASS